MAASPTAEPSFGLSSVVCKTCKDIAQQIKESWPDAEPILESLCELTGSSDKVKACLDMLRGAEDIFKNYSSQDICAALSLCKPSKQGTFEDFSGRF